jgi:hypothetical protein
MIFDLSSFVEQTSPLARGMPLAYVLKVFSGESCPTEFREDTVKSQLAGCGRFDLREPQFLRPNSESDELAVVTLSKHTQ